tara:strand:- start:189 stop:737 length:549 start_codon:yes stop_codon:yes gene_type:complete
MVLVLTILYVIMDVVVLPTIRILKEVVAVIVAVMVNNVAKIHIAAQKTDVVMVMATVVERVNNVAVMVFVVMKKNAVPAMETMEYVNNNVLAVVVLVEMDLVVILEKNVAREIVVPSLNVAKTEVVLIGVNQLMVKNRVRVLTITLVIMVVPAEVERVVVLMRLIVVRVFPVAMVIAKPTRA